jgi:hypothetical protein
MGGILKMQELFLMVCPGMGGILKMQEQFLMVCPGMGGILKMQEQFLMVCPRMGGQNFCCRKILSTYIHVSNDGGAWMRRSGDLSGNASLPEGASLFQPTIMYLGDGWKNVKRLPP